MELQYWRDHNKIRHHHDQGHTVGEHVLWTILLQKSEVFDTLSA